LDIVNHWLVSAKKVISPNFGERPLNQSIDLLVVHSISLPPGCYEGSAIDQFFTNALCCDEHPYYQQLDGMQVSSHLLIRRDGLVVQYVPFDKRAWHAGTSAYQGRENCNDFSIGIELEGTDCDIFEPIQYEGLAGVIKTLLRTYPTLTYEHIVGHSDVAPGRKTDPGSGFDWGQLQRLLVED